MQYPLMPKGTGFKNGDRLIGFSGEKPASWPLYPNLAISAGPGIDGIAALYRNSVEVLNNGLIRTSIWIDLTGLRSTASGDIIGDDGAGTASHLGQITTKVNGTIFAGKITCHEAPTGGDPDIDLYSAVEATGVEDAAITTLDETALVDSGDHTLGSVKILTALPAADEFLYLVAGATTNADYTAGILEIEMMGYR